MNKITAKRTESVSVSSHVDSYKQYQWYIVKQMFTMSNEKRYIFELIFGKTESRAVNLIVFLLFEIKNRRTYKKFMVNSCQ